MSAGINGHVVGYERDLREGSSDPSRLRVGSASVQRQSPPAFAESKSTPLANQIWTDGAEKTHNKLKTYTTSRKHLPNHATPTLTEAQARRDTIVIEMEAIWAAVVASRLLRLDEPSVGQQSTLLSG